MRLPKNVLMLGIYEPRAIKKQRKGKVTSYSALKNRLWTKGGKAVIFNSSGILKLDCDNDTCSDANPLAQPVLRKPITCWAKKKQILLSGYFRTWKNIIQN